MGKHWHEQNLGEPPIEIIRRIRGAIVSGKFDTKAFDHNSADYVPGLSNKQVEILASMLISNPKNRIDPGDMEECWRVVLEVVAPDAARNMVSA